MGQEPKPADVADEGQKPNATEGQEPADGDVTPDAPEGQGKTYTEAYVKQLRREAAQSRTKLSELEAKLNEYEERDKSEHERLTDKLTNAEKRASDAELRVMRYEIAAEHGLDLRSAAFLTGTTREEIELRAEELSKLLEERGQKPASGFDGGARERVPESTTPEQAHNELLLQSLGRSPRR